MVDLSRERAEAHLVGNDLAGQRHAHQRAAVKGSGEGDDARRPCGARALSLRRSRPPRRRSKARLSSWASSRNEPVQLLREADVVRRRRHLEARVSECLELLLHGSDHAGMAVPGIDHSNAGGEVDIALAGDIPDLGVARARRKICVAFATPRGCRLPFLQSWAFGLIFASLNCRDVQTALSHVARERVTGADRRLLELHAGLDGTGMKIAVVREAPVVVDFELHAALPKSGRCRRQRR